MRCKLGASFNFLSLTQVLKVVVLGQRCVDSLTRVQPLWPGREVGKKVQEQSRAESSQFPVAEGSGTPQPTPLTQWSLITEAHTAVCVTHVLSTSVFKYFLNT